ncbi:hypothetical protein PA25_01150 [Pseudoalteromonas sp. A25]|uniref:hypothetical protein n=1 Tax=Pseudoalteromonas sp. A25 TaxID=116092 RepID=UPI0012605806|nr:hypothetical protein [Pseudoalteromonas sp. A25]BBN80130.1 hypothetical protein PA25_01150 [Pseudoalteromonas sp. A25]
MIKYLCLAFSLFLSCALIAQSFVINVSEDVAYQMGKDKVRKSLEIIYAPLAIKPTLVFIPSRRGLSLLNRGEIDADAGRIDSAMISYENVLQVPYPLSTIRLFIYCIRPDDCMLSEGAEHLIVKGTVISELYCKKRRLKCNIVANDVSAFSALAKGFAPTLIANDRFSVGTLCASKIEEIYAKPLTGVLKAYHYVHKKHADLVPKLTESITALMSRNILQNSFQSLTDTASACGVKLTIMENMTLSE